MGNISVEIVSAFFAGIALLMGTWFARGKSGDAKPAEPKTAIHQELARPETQAEIRSADALEDIAEHVRQIDRSLLLFLSKSNP